MDLNKKIKLWSSLGMRATFGLIVMDLAEKYPDLMITTSDVSTSAGLDRFKNKYPEQFDNDTVSSLYGPSAEFNIQILEDKIQEGSKVEFDVQNDEVLALIS